MRNLAVCGAALPRLQPGNRSFANAQIDGVPATFAVLDTPEPAFDSGTRENRHKVVVRVRAFSCNYRDKGLILRMIASGPDESFYVIGSEFVGEVIAVGAEVSRVAVGDRVIGDNCYPNWRPEGWRPGIPTNHASREFLVLREEKVVRIPASMPLEVAAGFSIGAQTTYSMLDKLGIGPGSNVLVTSATSNTSLFALHALRSRGASVYATTTSTTADARLRDLGVKALFRVDSQTPCYSQHEELWCFAQKTGGFDCVLDPFFDLHLRRVLPIMALGARYATCGFFEQSPGTGANAFPGTRPNFGEALQIAMLRNIQLIGNCIGVTEDLERALKDYAAGVLATEVDSVFSDGQVGAFIERTFNTRDRFGKVVYVYD